MKKKSSYEGLQSKVRAMKTPEIEVWINQFADRDYTIIMDLPEFTCICPKTGLPDFAEIRIEYSPDKYCIELKSLKMYTIFWRNIGIFHENIINRMLEDFVKASDPKSVKITGIFNPRGGIATTVTREYIR